MDFFTSMPPMAIICWAILLGGVALAFVQKFRGKRKYAGQDMSVDTEWYEKSQAQYADDPTLRAYFFHPDKNFSQGHRMEDRNHQPVYEAKVLYNNVTAPDETDFINYILGYTHHHKVGHTVSSEAGNVTTASHFSFDGVNIWDYLADKGYAMQFHIHGLAYSASVTKDGAPVGTIYSSNNGKNFFNADGPIVPKMGGKGICVVECALKDIDAMFLYAMALARTDLSIEQFGR